MCAAGDGASQGLIESEINPMLTRRSFPVCDKIADGYYKTTHFNSEMIAFGQQHSLSDEQLYPEFENGPATYGVVDSPEQFDADFGQQMRDDARELAVFFTHIRKDPSNRGQGGGWRWRKWGEYLGHGTPQYEYLDDEEGFNNGVWVYHIHSVGDAPKNARLDRTTVAILSVIGDTR